MLRICQKSAAKNSINTGWRDAPLTMWNLAKVFKQVIIRKVEHGVIIRSWER